MTQFFYMGAIFNELGEDSENCSYTSKLYRWRRTTVRANHALLQLTARQRYMRISFQHRHAPPPVNYSAEVASRSLLGIAFASSQARSRRAVEPSQVKPVVRSAVPLMRWLQLRFDFDSTGVQRAFHCLSTVAE